MSEFLGKLRAIEEKWQQKWNERNVFRSQIDRTRPKYFVTVPYPYATGPLHLGHCRTYTLGDIIARFKRKEGYNVLWPMGFHITGTPVLAISHRIRQKEAKIWNQYREYLQIYEKTATKDEIDRIITTFEDPMACAMYFSGKLMEDFFRMGFSIDDTRQFTTGDAEYSKFIQWQYYKLMDKGFITKGNYPILWCPTCGNAVGEDDILGGDEEKTEVNEFIGVKFRLTENSFLIASTLRPETIFGATNVWVNPSAEYIQCETQFDSQEIWVIAKGSLARFERQGYVFEDIKPFPVDQLIGVLVKLPYVDRSIPVLPASFVDPAHASGVVYSVPAHAPYDYIALKELQQNLKDLENFPLFRNQPDMKETVKNLTPIVIINVEKYQEAPAIAVCTELGITSQTEVEKLEIATQQVYKAEFYSGQMKSNTEYFAGMSVEAAKNKAHQKYVEDQTGIFIFEPSRIVRCRCGTQIQVAVIADQYFLNYGDPRWKETALRALDTMEISPKKYRTSFERIFEWLDKRPCVRKRGLGTEFPFTPGKGWIIESLSDSVIYMAFYCIIQKIREYNIRVDQLTPEFFDFVFLNQGDCKKISNLTQIPIEFLKKMQEEFQYWYPNDIRHTAVAHISNHLSFAIFHHAAIFPEEEWIKKFSLNELLIREGQKMGKSKGNVIPISKIPEKYSVDLARLHLASIATADSVIDWKEKEAALSLKRLVKFWNIALSVQNYKEPPEADRHFYSQVVLAQIKQNLKMAITTMEEINIRDYSHLVFFDNLSILEKYQRQTDIMHISEAHSVIREIVVLMIDYVSPIIPHMCEELAARYELIGDSAFISTQAFQSISISDVEIELIHQWKFIADLQEDMEQIVSLSNITPKMISFYITPAWKQALYKLLHEELAQKEVNIGKIISIAKLNPKLRPFMKEIAQEAKFIQKNNQVIRQVLFSQAFQTVAIKNGIKLYQYTFPDTKFQIVEVDGQNIYDPGRKASKARPMRPAIFIE